MDKEPLFVLSSNRSKKDFFIQYEAKLELIKNIDKAFNDEKIDDYFYLFDKESISDSTNHILPSAISIAELYEKITYSKKAKIPKDMRYFFMFEALKNVKEHVKDGFLTKHNEAYFLELSDVMFGFYDELKQHKIPINMESFAKFISIDSYDEYEQELSILADIYHQYSLILEANNFSDNNDYEIFMDYLQYFSSIHIELEGFISPLQYEILKASSSITPIFLYFKTDVYNMENFKILKQNLNPHNRYIYGIHNNILYSKNDNKLDISALKLYKTSKVFNQANLALHLAHQWNKEIMSGNASENDYAVILPNEDFCHYLATLDSNGIFNFAMGINVKSLVEYNVLESIFHNFLESDGLNSLQSEESLKNEEFLRRHSEPPVEEFGIPKDVSDRPQHDAYRHSERSEESASESLVKEFKIIDLKPLRDFKNDDILLKDYDIRNPDLNILQAIIEILFKNESKILNAGMEILSELLYMSEREFINTKKLDFTQLFNMFITRFSNVSKDDVAGGKIKVMGALEARNLCFKEILIVDFTDDFVPKVPYHDMFINSNIRKAFNMPTRKDKENLFKHHYYNIMKNTTISHISYVINHEKIPSNMLLELHCDMEDSQNIDEKYSYYDSSENLSSVFYEDCYPSFNVKFALSSTSLNIYNECVRKFYFSYIEGLKSDEIDIAAENNKSLGTYLHEWLMESYRGYEDKVLCISDIDEIEKKFNENYYNFSYKFQKNIELYARLDTYHYYIKKMFDTERDRVSKNKIKILGLEQKFEAILHNFEISGKIDRLDLVDDRLLIIDYKSGSKPANSNLQMTLYKICLSDSDTKADFMSKIVGAEIDCAFYLLKDAKLDVIKYNVKNEIRIKQILENIGKENIMTDSISTCKQCEYKDICGR